MRKILQFPIAASLGGRTQYILNLWKMLDRNNLHFDFVTFSKNLDFAKELIQNGCIVYQISVYPETDMEQFVLEFEKILDAGYDAIEVHTSFWKNTIVEELARRKGIEIIIHAHSSGISMAKDANEEKRLLAKHMEIRDKIDVSLADYYVACSHSAAEWLYGSNIPKDKIQILYNTVDTERFAYHADVRERMREQLGLSNKFVIGHVGRLERVKNQQFLIEIFAEIRKRMEQAVLLIIGNGELEETLKSRAKDLGIETSVIFAGKKTDTQLYYQAMDVFVLPSLLEGFPLVLLEAQCSGLRCICSKEITTEVNITDNICFLPLENRKDWVKEIMNAAGSGERTDRSEMLRQQGFDTISQIKEMEETLYR